MRDKKLQQGGAEGRKKPGTKERDQEFMRLSEAAADEVTRIDPRAEKIRMLKQQVRDGTYAPDLKKVALILVHDEGETLVSS